MNTPPDKAGLLWIGEKFYPTPDDWLKEANELGVSRRIAMIPKGFVVGSTWVFAAHRKTFPDPRDPEKWTAGVFHVFRPARLEYIVKGNETEEELTSLEKRGCTLVRVIRDGQPDLIPGEEEDTTEEEQQ